MRPLIEGSYNMANYEKMYHIIFNAAQDAQRVAKLFIIRCPCRPAGVFYVLPPAGYFCHQRQKYPKTPLETTFQDFLGALRPVSNLPHVPRVIAFPVCRCRSKGLCHHSFPLPLRCRCPVPRQQRPPLPPYRGTPHPNATSLVRTVIPSQPAGWRGNPFL